MSELGLNMEVEPPKRPNTEKKGRGAVVLAVLVFIGVIGFIGVLLVRQFLGGGGEDYAGEGNGEVIIEVQDGQTLSEIGTTLKENGVVASADSFIDAAASNDQAQTIGPGYYRLAERMSAQAALEAMLDPANQVIIRAVIPEGLRMDQVVKRLSEASDIPAGRFEAAIMDASALGLP